MIEEGIRDGDYVVVERRAVARNGETVVALIRGEEATLKMFRQEGTLVTLVPANPAVEPITVRADEVAIQGWWSRSSGSTAERPRRGERATGAAWNA